MMVIMTIIVTPSNIIVIMIVIMKVSRERTLQTAVPNKIMIINVDNANNGNVSKIIIVIMVMIKV
jgi:hypothetical protein